VDEEVEEPGDESVIEADVGVNTLDPAAEASGKFDV